MNNIDWVTVATYLGVILACVGILYTISIKKDIAMIVDHVLIGKYMDYGTKWEAHNDIWKHKWPISQVHIVNNIITIDEKIVKILSKVENNDLNTLNQLEINQLENLIKEFIRLVKRIIE